MEFVDDTKHVLLLVMANLVQQAHAKPAEIFSAVLTTLLQLNLCLATH